MFKKAMVSLIAVIGLGLAAGGSVHADQKIPANKPYTKVGQYKKLDTGKYTYLKKSLVNKDVSDGPLTVHIIGASITGAHYSKAQFNKGFGSEDISNEYDTTLASPGKHNAYLLQIYLSFTNTSNSTIEVNGMENITLTDTGKQIDRASDPFTDPFGTSVGPHATTKQKVYPLFIKKSDLKNKNIHITMYGPDGEAIADDASIDPKFEFDIPLTNK